MYWGEDFLSYILRMSVYGEVRMYRNGVWEERFDYFRFVVYVICVFVGYLIFGVIIVLFLNRSDFVRIV